MSAIPPPATPEALPIRRMPWGFGPTPGPRQGPDRSAPSSAQAERLSVAVSFRTDPERLQELLPPRFRLVDPLVTVEAGYLSNLAWLAGRGYNLLSVSFPVEYRGEVDTARGQFVAVMFENLADPIISGREELGYAKVYAELPDARFENDTVRCVAAWDGFEFLSFSVGELRPAPLPESRPAPALHYKYIPATGDLGQPDVAYACLTPDAASGRRAVEAWTGIGQLEARRGGFAELPTLFHVADGLSGLAVREVVAARVVRYVGAPSLNDQRRLR